MDKESAGELGATTDLVTTMFHHVNPGTTGSTLMIAGLILILLSVLVASRIAKGGDFPPPFRWAFFSSLALGTVLLLVGPVTARLQTEHGLIARIPVEESFVRLGENTRVGWLIRLIPYDPEKEQHLAVGKFVWLGHERQRFTFVANYHELRGYTVEQAVRMAGGSFRPGQHVSAVIFRLDAELLPANAKGLLQAVTMVQSDSGAQLAHRFPLDERDLKDITTSDAEGLVRWSWDGYGMNYPSLCRLAVRFRCGTFSEQEHIGQIADDWHPLGFASREPSASPPCGEEAERVCMVRSWEDAMETYQGRFGARIFLVRNRPLGQLASTYLIHFDDPQTQIIPDIGVPDPS